MGAWSCFRASPRPLLANHDYSWATYGHCHIRSYAAQPDCKGPLYALDHAMFTTETGSSNAQLYRLCWR